LLEPTKMFMLAPVGPRSRPDGPPVPEAGADNNETVQLNSDPAAVRMRDDDVASPTVRPGRAPPQRGSSSSVSGLCAKRPHSRRGRVGERFSAASHAQARRSRCSRSASASPSCGFGLAESAENADVAALGDHTGVAATGSGRSTSTRTSPRSSGRSSSSSSWRGLRNERCRGSRDSRGGSTRS